MTKKTTVWGKEGAYTIKSMKFAVAERANEPSSQTFKVIAWVYAALLVVMVVGQLFSFEKFIPLLGDYWLPGGDGTATLLASLIVFFEVFSLPFLLRMPLSPLMRWFSLACGLLVAGIWVMLGIVAVMSDSTMTNSGILGVKVAVPFGDVQLAWAIAMTALALASTYGLWPLRKH